MAVESSAIPDEISSRTLSAEEKRRMAVAPGNVAAQRLVFLRRATQLVCLGLFVLFFFTTAVGATQWFGVPKQLFLSLDILNTLKNGIASHHIAVAAIGPAIFVVLLTLWGGRIFCGWICPLGTTIDISDRMLFRPGRLFGQRRRSETRRFRNWKYIYLLAGLGAVVFGVDILTFGDPLSLLTRTFTLVIYGPLAYLWNAVLAATDQLGISRLVFRAFGWEMSNWNVVPLVFFNALPVLLVFTGVIALSVYQERFWCRNLCPYGALLGLISRVSWLGHVVNRSTCLHCRKCELRSRMGSYENLGPDADEEIQHDLSECIQCFRCETICPPDAIRIRAQVPAALATSWQKVARRVKRGLRKLFRRGQPDKLQPRSTPGPVAAQPALAAQPPLEVGRRRVLAAIGGGLLLGLGAKVNAANYRGPLRGYGRYARSLRPPGSLPEAEFLSACTRCSMCMKVCPTNGLQPALLETGPEGIWTPLLVPAVGACAEKCTACGDVCPTRAIRPFSWHDKRCNIKIGLAVVNRSTCIAWNGGRDCVVCAEVCPYSAVIFRDTWDDTLPRDESQPLEAPGNRGRVKRVPTVDEKACTGCGLCEYHCPVLPEHAIPVYASNENRQYKPLRETPLDGFWRGDWERRKVDAGDCGNSRCKYGPQRPRNSENKSGNN